MTDVFGCLKKEDAKAIREKKGDIPEEERDYYLERKISFIRKS
jgi:hypothetical protein